MPEFKFRRGTEAQVDSFLGAEAEITVTTDTHKLVLHDGTTIGGVELLKKSELDGYPSNATATRTTDGTLSSEDKLKIDSNIESRFKPNQFVKESKIINDNGVLKNNGKPIREIGYNLFYLSQTIHGEDASYRAWGYPDDYLREFEILAQEGIRYVRLSALVYLTQALHDLYIAGDKDEYFQRIRNMFDVAAEYNIGIVATMFWEYYCMPDVVGETINEAYATTNSQTMIACRDFIDRFWNAIGDHPAFAGWEIGNEYNIAAENNSKPNLSGTEWYRTDHQDSTDSFSLEQMYRFFENMSAHIRTHDSERIILSGNSNTGGVLPLRLDYYTDTLVPLENGGDIDTLSNHIYSMHQFVNYDYQGAYEIIRKIRLKGEELGKPFVLGEFGAAFEGTMEDMDSFRTQKAILDIIERTGVQLSFSWAWRKNLAEYPDSAFTNHIFNTTDGGLQKHNDLKETLEKIRRKGYIHPDDVPAKTLTEIGGKYVDYPAVSGMPALGPDEFARLEIPADASLQSSNGATLSFWFKFNQTYNFLRSQIIYSQTVDTGFNIGINNIVEEMVLTVRFADGSLINTGSSINTDLNDWVHYTFAFDTSQAEPYLAVYVNGLKHGFVIRGLFGEKQFNPYTGVTTIFNLPGGGSTPNSTIGSMKNLRWFNRLLIDSEVTNLYEHDIFPNDNSLVGKWDFNDNLLDTSGNENNAEVSENFVQPQFLDFPY